MTKKLYGSKADQVPTNADLGTMAYQDKENVNLDGLRFSTGLAQQEWVGTYGTLAQGASFSLFAIKAQYDNLCFELDIFMNIGSYHATLYRGVFGYSSFAEAVASGQTSYNDLSRTGTTYNETMTMTNNGGSGINELRMSLRVHGLNSGQNRPSGGSDLITSDVLTRIR